MIRIENVHEQPNYEHHTPQARRSILHSIALRPAASYPNAATLQFELRVREHTVAAARALNESGAAFSTFDTTRGNPDYWNVAPNGALLLRPGRKPSEALRDIFANGPMYGFECATAIVIVFYKAVLESIGDQAYDLLFANTMLFHWNVDRDLGLTTVPTNRFIPGDALYFDNPDVDPDSPQWQGENVIAMGGGLYYGHGIGITGPEDIIRVLNQYRRPDAQRSAFLLDQATRPGYAAILQAAGSLPEPYTYTGHSQLPSGFPMRAVVGSIVYLD